MKYLEAVTVWGGFVLSLIIVGLILSLAVSPL